jgi:hypothetical protein
MIKIGRPPEILYNYPIRIKLSSKCGAVKQNLTDIFKELEYEWMQYKVAFTQDDGITQLYGEIQNWNYPTSGSFNSIISDPVSAQAEANIWVNIPEMGIYEDTYIYMYFDKNAIDNIEYVNTIGTSAGSRVWNDNFIGVYHFEDYPDKSADIVSKESTSNHYNAYPSGSLYTSGSSAPSASIIGRSYKFFDNDAYFDLGFNSITGPVTFEMLYKPPSGSAEGMLFSNNLEYPNYQLSVTSSNNLKFGYNHNNSYEEYITSTMTMYTSSTTITGGNEGWFYIAGISDNNTLKVYINTWYEEQDVNYPGYSPNNISNTYKFGASHNTSVPTTLENFIECGFDELRISNVARSIGWLDYTYWNYTDNVVEFIT